MRRFFPNSRAPSEKPASSSKLISALETGTSQSTAGLSKNILKVFVPRFGTSRRARTRRSNVQAEPELKSYRARRASGQHRERTNASTPPVGKFQSRIQSSSPD